MLKYILADKFLEPPVECPLGVAEIMRACWRIDPKERISFGEINERFARMVVNSRPKFEMCPPRPLATFSDDEETDVDDYNFCGSTEELRPKNQKLDQDGYLNPNLVNDGKPTHAYENSVPVALESVPPTPSTSSSTILT